MALFVRDRVFEHYAMTEEDQAMLVELLSLIALLQLRQEGKVIFKGIELAEIFQGFPWGLPDDHQAQEMVREHMERYQVSAPLKRLLYAAILVEITYTLAKEDKLLWVKSPAATVA
ncbi:MAG: hypothetical protein ACE5HK_04460 [Candidatus Methylomirabilales bacterium]